MNIKLPPNAAKLADLIGSDNVIALIDLARSNGGRCFVYIPVRPRAGNQIAKLIGIEAAKKLAREYGGQDIEIPKCKAIDRAQRAAEIKRLASDGITHVEIAKRFELCTRQVRNLLRNNL
ncbi:MAG: hypothetical protein RL651_303 [Pseudomonadota bacterium]|jgi:DNA-binding NarL/FixJ family response regulator